jgi:hypothetical protein
MRDSCQGSVPRFSVKWYMLSFGSRDFRPQRAPGLAFVAPAAARAGLMASLSTQAGAANLGHVNWSREGLAAMSSGRANFLWKAFGSGREDRSAL